MYQTLINTAALKTLVGQSNIRIIDCRFALADTENGRKEYSTAHIPGAIYAHLDDDLSGEIIPGKTGRHPFPIVADFAKKLSTWGIDETTQVVVYDQGHGGIAARLWFLLKWLGHQQVAVLNGGWKNWLAEGGATNNETVAVNPSVFTPRPQSNLLVDVDFMQKELGNEDYLYVDSRAAARYRGENEPIDPIAGHIPGAISAPFLENLGEDGLFLPKKDLAKRFLEKMKLQSQQKAIFYCGSGVTACHNLLALHHIGLRSIRLFPGSWSEWIVDENREVAIG
jgi:thiosulfate/3-mercaptopyruvate sulfurtransferase